MSIFNEPTTGTRFSDMESGQRFKCVFGAIHQKLNAYWAQDVETGQKWMVNTHTRKYQLAD
ncbi:MAG: hypothetical protein C9356_11915 [Oleiphilus sp.]|nr:MAG: hypothetical protein C9356_11915 [Oleiphilus sp.]